MGAYNRQSFLVLFTITILYQFASSTYLSVYMDIRCNVIYNDTMLLEDGKDEQFSDCYNVTLKDDGQEHTLSELQDCISRCYIWKSDLFNKEGKFIENELYGFYEKYSNASSHYISSVAKVLNNCVGKAGEEVKKLKANGDDVRSCTYFGLYDICTEKDFDAILANATLSAEFCGEGNNYISSTESVDASFEE